MTEILVEEFKKIFLALSLILSSPMKCTTFTLILVDRLIQMQ